MRNNVTKLKKKGEKFNLIDYRYAKDIVDDYPKLLSVLDKLIPILRERSQYMAVWQLLQTAEESRLLLRNQFEYYREIYKKKGKVTRG